MKAICFYFQIHQPFRLKRYRFFDIGSDHYYYDDYNDEEIIRRIAQNCYLPANQTILNMIKEYGGKIIFSSDCHHKNYLECFFEEAEALAKKVGFTKRYSTCQQALLNIRLFFILGQLTKFVAYI